MYSIKYLPRKIFISDFKNTEWLIFKKIFRQFSRTILYDIPFIRYDSFLTVLGSHCNYYYLAINIILILQILYIDRYIL